MSIYTSAFLAVSLDGYIAGPDGSLEWLQPYSSGDYGYTEFISRIDAVLMGRGTFEKVITFDDWPYKIPVFVYSGTIQKIPDKISGKAHLQSGYPAEVLRNLENKGFKNIYIDGGKTVSSFISEGLLNHLILFRMPDILGGGIPLFGGIKGPLRLETVSSETMGAGAVRTHYRLLK